MERAEEGEPGESLVQTPRHEGQLYEFEDLDPTTLPSTFPFSLPSPPLSRDSRSPVGPPDFHSVRTPSTMEAGSDRFGPGRTGVRGDGWEGGRHTGG